MTDESTAAPPPPRGRPRSFWVAVVLAIMLLCSFAALLPLAYAGLGRQNDERPFAEAFIRGDRQASDKVLDIALTGTIADVDAGSPSLVASIIAQLRQARTDDAIKGVLIEMNTPGGGITASDILYHEIDRFRIERKIPVVVLCNDVTASGGYYAAMGTDHIMAHETSLVGSIGVIAQLPDVSGLMGKVGVRMNVVKSKRADGSESFKDIGSPYREMTSAERALMQDLIQRMWGRFVDVVASGRKGKLTRDQIAALADGRVWTGRQALDLKLVDSLGYQEDAYAKVLELAHLEKSKLVRYKRPFNLFGDLFGVRESATDMRALLEQALDPAGSTAPRLMYLWSVR